jgi:hypothetical protein
MATSYSPKIVTDGLIMCVDFTNPKTYTSGSTFVSNMANNAETGSIVNSSALQLDSNVGLRFAQGPYVRMQTNHNSLVNGTYLTWIKFPSTASVNVGRRFWGTTEGTGSNVYGFQYMGIDSAGLIFASNGKGGNGPDPVVSSSVDVHDTQWHMVTYQYVTGDKLYLQIDNNQTIGPSFPSKGQQGTLSYIGADNNGSNPISASIGTIMFYNKMLTQQELTQNYNALRSKFGV